MPTRLPAEIIAHILETIICASPTASTLASLARVARSFRHTANAARFRRLDVFLNTAPARTKRLAGILSSESAVWPEHERAAHHIHSLHLTFGSYDSQNASFSDRLDESAEVSIATILNAVSRAHFPATKGLHIRISSPNECTVHGRYTVHVRSLATLHPEVRLALHQLCTSSNAETLELHNLSDVPSALVLSSRAAAVDINGVRFSFDLAGTHLGFPFKNIRRIAVRDSPSFLDILRKLPYFPSPALETLELTLGRYIRHRPRYLVSPYDKHDGSLHRNRRRCIPHSRSTAPCRPRTIDSNPIHRLRRLPERTLQHAQQHTTVLRISGSIDIGGGFSDPPEDAEIFHEPALLSAVRISTSASKERTTAHTTRPAPRTTPWTRYTSACITLRW